MRKLKVLLVVDSLSHGGSERSLVELLPFLLRNGVEPVVVCLWRKKEGFEETVREQGFDLRFLDQATLVRRIIALRRIIKEVQPDVVHSTLFHSNIATRIATFNSGIPSVSSIVSTPYTKVRFKDPNIRPLALRIIRTIDAYTARHLTTRLHAVSEAAKDHAVSEMGIPASKIIVVQRGRSCLRSLTLQERDNVRQQLAIRQGDRLILNVGRHEYAKGQKCLLQAMSRLLSSRPSLVMLLVGRAGTQTDELTRLARALRLQDRVRFLGHRDDVPDLLAAADLFAFPSLYEGLPGAVIEAMAAGLPIVASRIPAIEEMVEDGGNALLVESGSPGHLAAAMNLLLGDEEKMATFGARSRRIFEERFTLERSGSEMIQLYHLVAEQGAGQTATEEVSTSVNGHNPDYWMARRSNEVPK